MFSLKFARCASALSLLYALTVSFVADAHVATVQVMELTDPKRGRTMEVWVWGPASVGEGTQKLAGNSVFEPVAGRPDSPYAPGRHPLLVLFHGTSGNARSMAWLSAGLAERGYMVVSANHPGSTSLDVSEESLIQTWLQAEDGTFLIDSLLASEQFARSIDADRIASIGFSLGGYSALAIAGVRLRIEELQAFCRRRPDEETCRLFPAALFGPAVDGRPQDRSLGDSRIRAAVSLAPGFVPAFDAGSIEAIGFPVMVIVGSSDLMLPVGQHGRPLAGRFPRGEYVELSGVSHFSFLGPCTEAAPAILREEGVEFICQDAAGSDRRKINAAVLAYVDRFLAASFGLTAVDR